MILKLLKPSILSPKRRRPYLGAALDLESANKIRTTQIYLKVRVLVFAIMGLPGIGPKSVTLCEMVRVFARGTHVTIRDRSFMATS